MGRRGKRFPAAASGYGKAGERSPVVYAANRRSHDAEFARLVPRAPQGGQLASMSGLVDAEKILLHLSRAEKAQLLQWIARDLGDAFPGIESVPGVCGGDVVVVRTRIPVWLLEKARREGLSDGAILS